MLVVAIVLDVAYWSIWFTDRDGLASEHRAAYYEFENAFPLADAWLGRRLPAGAGRSCAPPAASRSSG